MSSGKLFRVKHKEWKHETKNTNVRHMQHRGTQSEFRRKIREDTLKALEEYHDDIREEER